MKRIILMVMGIGMMLITSCKKEISKECDSLSKEYERLVQVEDSLFHSLGSTSSPMEQGAIYEEMKVILSKRSDVGAKRVKGNCY